MLINEPVAELVLEQMSVGDASSLRVKWLVDNYPPVGTKLYTHSVKELKNIVLASATCSCGKVMEVTNLQAVKELTDEEIEELIWNTTDMKDFARAILRKAQEK